MRHGSWCGSQSILHVTYSGMATLWPWAMAASIRKAPGSLMTGVPASLTSATTYSSAAACNSRECLTRMWATTQTSLTYLSGC